MRILADECCDARIVAALRDDGHDVVFVAESQSAASDDELLRLALLEARILITEDKDFGRLVVEPAAPTAGVILMRMLEAPIAEKIARVRLILAEHAADLPRSLIVVARRRVRIRRL